METDRKTLTSQQREEEAQQQAVEREKHRQEGIIIGIVRFQAMNGLLDANEAKQILNDTKAAESGTLFDMEAVYASVLDTLNRKGLRQRVTYLWGLHVWVYLASLTAVLLTLLISGVINRSVVVGLSFDVIAWGGLGGCAFSIYHLRDNVFQLRLSKYYGLYYMAYPLGGMVLGLATAFMFAAGLLPLQGQPGYTFFAAIAFVAGMLQHWAVGTLQDIADAIHKSQPI